MLQGQMEIAAEEWAVLPVLLSVFVKQPCLYTCKRKPLINLDYFHLFYQTHLGNPGRICIFVQVSFHLFSFQSTLRLVDRHWGSAQRTMLTLQVMYLECIPFVRCCYSNSFNTARHYSFEDTVWVKLQTYPHGQQFQGRKIFYLKISIYTFWDKRR